MADATRSTAPDTNHWAYQQGKAVGLTGDTVQRGIMAFGLSCAGDSTTARNTQQWLAGFDAGLADRAAPQPPVAHFGAYDRTGMRQRQAGA